MSLGGQGQGVHSRPADRAGQPGAGQRWRRPHKPVGRRRNEKKPAEVGWETTEGVRIFTHIHPICQLLEDGEVRWETIGEYFFYFFQKNKNKDGEERWGTVGDALRFLVMEFPHLDLSSQLITLIICNFIFDWTQGFFRYGKKSMPSKKCEISEISDQIQTNSIFLKQISRI